MAPVKDPILVAIEAVHEALKQVDAPTRTKVVASVAAILEIPGVSPTIPSVPAVPQAPVGQSRPTASRPLSPVELLGDKRPRSNSQRITLFAYYRDKYEGLLRFGRSDLQPYFAKSKLAPPANFDRDFNDAVKNGWLHEDGDQSYVTTKGIELVESGFQSSPQQSAPAKRKTPGKKTKRNPKKKQTSTKRR